MGFRKKILINQDLIMEKIADIEKSISLLDRIAVIEKKDLLNDQIAISGAKYQLILAIEAAQNICNHLAARLAKEAPKSYADCFRILEENRIISKDLALNLVSMAKFRNLLVHQYGRVDDSIVYSVLKSDTRDLINYTDQIKSFLLLAEGGKKHGQREAPPDGRREKED